MNRNNYSSIQNLQQLRQAREKAREAAELKEYELEMDIAACKDALNPVTYLNRLIAKLYTMESLAKYFVKGYEFVKGFFNSNQEETETVQTNK